MVKVLEHEHPLILIDLCPPPPPSKEEEEESDENEDENEHDDFVIENDFRYPCDRCGDEINSYHRYYYKCSDSCDFSLHKFCTELPTTLKHALHIAHDLVLQQRGIYWICDICRSHHDDQEISYLCSSCQCDIDIRCVVAKEEKRIYHPSHPHPLVNTSKPILCECDACGKKHEGIFYRCTICSCFSIHVECAFLPKKLKVQETTDNNFSHSHPLTLSYSFPYVDRQAKFNPKCRICGYRFEYPNLWIYKCEKCRYYAHLDCATSRREPFMSIISYAGLGKTVKNFKDVDHPDLLHLPFPDQTHNLLKHLFFKEAGDATSSSDEGSLMHMSHEHPLVLVDTQCNDIKSPTSSRIKPLSCHNPMKRIELLCNGCLRPIMTMPFYKCSNEDEHCNFVLHEWCTRLPAKVHDHPGDPHHTLELLPNVPGKFCGVFNCRVCRLPCNGFVYHCDKCGYCIDISCGFIPEKITHEAHPNHLLSRASKPLDVGCHMCSDDFYEDEFSFSCSTCNDIRLHVKCALLLPQTIRHKYDKHPMKLSYFPIENHKSDYFCEICELELNPELCFYHCHECMQSMHPACSSLILQSETYICSYWFEMMVPGVHSFVNIKFGGIHNIEGHPHPLLFIQGIKSDDVCSMCKGNLQYQMIFKCLQCNFVCDYRCCKDLSMGLNKWDERRMSDRRWENMIYPFSV